jgi:hypothetical protein
MMYTPAAKSNETSLLVFVVVLKEATTEPTAFNTVIWAASWCALATERLKAERAERDRKAMERFEKSRYSL